MLTVGLTGGIGSGKTTVSNLFHDLGAPVIDTDIISHELVASDQSVLKEIVDAFGDDIVLDDGTLDRKQLAQIVFNDKKSRRQLENILHPKIRTEVKNQIQTYNSKSPAPQYVLIVIPLLFETGFRDLIDRILVITSDENIRIERIIQRDHRDKNEIRSIIDSQVTDEIRTSKADDVIENNNNLKELENQVQQLHRKYINSSLSAQ